MQDDNCRARRIAELDAQALLADICALPGVSGNEKAVADRVEQEFKAICDEAWQDRMFNVYGSVKGGGPGAKVMLCAHMDEIGMMVTDIRDDGFLRFTNVGGIDRRILLSQEVVVWGNGGENKLVGIIGAKPPHVMSEKDQRSAVKMDDMAIDIGMCQRAALESVRVGDIVTFYSPLKQLMGDALACKTMDDRACIAVLAETVRELSKLRFSGEAVFVATHQEEVGSKGAKTGAWTIMPDIAIALDVTHGDIPGAPPDTTFPLEKPAITVGPNLHPTLVKQLKKVAKEQKIDLSISAVPRPTATDASELQMSREGIPTLLVEIPLRYMHTTVETLRYSAVRDAAKLLAYFIASLGEGWEEFTCL